MRRAAIATKIGGGSEGEQAIEIFTPDWAPFTVALLVMLAIGIVEALALFAGFSPTAAVEAALPEMDLPDMEAPEMSGADFGPLSLVLGWLSVGRLPLLAWLVLALTSFALAGFAIQGLAVSAIGAPLAGWLAAIPALCGAALATRHVGRWLGRIFPKDHTEVASQKELIGSFATIIRGEARQGQPAEAKTEDLRGRSHYVLLEPAEPDTVYRGGDRVFIVSQHKNIYRAVTRVSGKEE